MRYVIFGRESCPYCVKAVQLLEERKENHKFVNFQESQSDILQEVKEAYGWPTVPIVIQIKDRLEVTIIGGYTDLVKHFED